MKRLLPLGLFVLVACTRSEPPAKTGQGATPAAAAADGQPRIVFTKEHHDFGTVPAGEVQELVFTFRNAGRGTLIIERAQGS